jgi:hypothetical protein
VAADESWIVLGMLGGRLAFFSKDDSLVPVHLLSTRDWPRDLEIRGDTLYVAESWAGLGIYDMADPVGGVELISRLEFDGVHVWSLAVDLPFAYFASGDSGLIVVDLSDPAAPAEAAHINLGARALSLLKSGDTVYVGFEESGIAVVDVRVPVSPLELNLLQAAYLIWL